MMDDARLEALGESIRAADGLRFAEWNEDGFREAVDAGSELLREVHRLRERVAELEAGLDATKRRVDEVIGRVEGALETLEKGEGGSA